MQRELVVAIQPLERTIHRGTIMLVTNREGWITGGRTGLFAYDTRYLSAYRISFDGFSPIFLTAEQANHDAAVFTYTNPPFRAHAVDVPELALTLRVVRIIEDQLCEEIEITSYLAVPIQMHVMIHLDSAFDDLFEVRALQPTPPRVARALWDPGERLLRFVYRDAWFSRELRYRITSADSPPSFAPALLIFPVTLVRGQTWRAAIAAEPTGTPSGRSAGLLIENPPVDPAPSPRAADRMPSLAAVLDRFHRRTESWTAALAQVETPNQVVERAYAQAVRDLAALCFQRVGPGWYPAAGVPWFNAIFGRDALITAIQGLPIGCPFPEAVLTRLAELQGQQVNLWTGEEPGRIPHELRVGQLSLMGRIPFDPYYGSADASLLYVILLSETYRFTGDRALLERFAGAMDGCLRWAAEFGDRDDDGFIEYWPRYPGDYHNQGWKDSGDAIVYPDGRIVPTPIAIVEVQGYYVDALRRAAEIYRVLGRGSDAARAAGQAAALQAALEEAFWLPDLGFYALGLDPAKRPIRSIASNPGHLLWSGAVTPEHAARVAGRLLEPDLFAGWGVRTLSTGNAAYAPLSYQRGSIWPHDNALIALGLKRYGHWEAANRIAEGIFAASGFFARGQLPELWGGFACEETVWPVIYPRANVPQAWAAGSVPMLLRTILGLWPDVERRVLILDPTLPEWLDDLTLRGLRFLDGSVDLRCRGVGRSTEIEILRMHGSFRVERKEAYHVLSRDIADAV
jgi:glycogen debranching enzyme